METNLLASYVDIFGNDISEIRFNIKVAGYESGNNLTHFMLLVSFYTPWNHQKTKDFLMFSGGRVRDQ